MVMVVVVVVAGLRLRWCGGVVEETKKMGDNVEGGRDSRHWRDGPGLKLCSMPLEVLCCAVLLRSGTGWDCPRKMEASEAVTERGEGWWGSVCSMACQVNPSKLHALPSHAHAGSGTKGVTVAVDYHYHHLCLRGWWREAW